MNFSRESGLRVPEKQLRRKFQPPCGFCGAVAPNFQLKTYMFFIIYPLNHFNVMVGYHGVHLTKMAKE